MKRRAAVSAISVLLLLGTVACEAGTVVHTAKRCTTKQVRSRDRHGKRIIRRVKSCRNVIIGVTGPAHPGASPAASRSGARDPFTWPFASTSIWNTPIGSGAVYAPAGLTAFGFRPEPIGVYREDPSNPVWTIHRNNGVWPPQCTDTGQGPLPPATLRLPATITLPNPDANSTIAVVGLNGKVYQFGEACVNNGSHDMYVTTSEHASTVAGAPRLTDDGNLGMHAGGGISNFGGLIRNGELEAAAPIRHALELNVWAKKLSNTNGGFRWPAIVADGYHDDGDIGYQGSNPQLKMGSLLALPPGTTPESLGLSTAFGRKVFHAMQDYGGYVGDDSGWDDVDVSVEDGVQGGLRALFTDSAEVRDMRAVVGALSVVTNNGPGSIGGGGWPRTAFAPAV